MPWIQSDGSVEGKIVDSPHVSIIISIIRGSPCTGPPSPHNAQPHPPETPAVAAGSRCAHALWRGGDQCLLCVCVCECLTQLLMN